MATIKKTVDINSSADLVWREIADTSKISEMIGFLQSSVQTGNERVCTLEGGGELKEKIVSVDSDLRRVSYTITESPLNMDFHSASMEVLKSGDRAQLIWTVDLLPDAAADQMGPMLEGACADIADRLQG